MNERATTADPAVEEAFERINRAVVRARICLDEHERRATDEQERVCTACGGLFRPVPALDRLCGICGGRERARAEERPPLPEGTKKAVPAARDRTATEQ